MDRRTHKSKEALKSALIELLHSKKIHEVQIKQLCDKADVNRSTFYSNYCDVNEILTEIYQDAIHVISSQVINLTLAENYTEEKMYHAIYHALSFFQENDDYFSILFSQPAKTSFEELLYTHYMSSYNLNHLGTLEQYRLLYKIIGSFSIIRAWMTEKYVVSAHELTMQLMELIGDDMNDLVKIHLKPPKNLYD